MRLWKHSEWFIATFRPDFDPGADFRDPAVGETRKVSFDYYAVGSHGAESNAAGGTVPVAGSNDAPTVPAVEWLCFFGGKTMRGFRLFKRAAGLIAVAGLFAGAAALAQQPPGAGPGAPFSAKSGLPERDPISAVGHGAIIGPDGRSVKPSTGFIRLAQLYYMDRLRRQAPRQVRAELPKFEQRLAEWREATGMDPALEGSLLIDWLITRVEPADAIYLRAKNTVLRRTYLEKILKRPTKEEPLEYGSGLPADLFDLAFKEGIVEAKATEASGKKYITECKDAGVPIPPDWGTDAWKPLGELSVDFVTPTSLDDANFPDESSDAYLFESGSPNGVCIALPRITGNNIGLLGVICLGRGTGNACFWDRVNTTVGDVVPIEDFMGGADLGATGICSDCHAGENPFVVHPGTALAQGGTLASPVWHTPLVEPGWPQNPGPTNLLNFLELEDDEQDCQSCHFQGFAGRFPEVGALPGYCSMVLQNAIDQTMPPFLEDEDVPEPFGTFAEYKAAFSVHADALKAFCTQNPPGGGVEPVDPIDEDPDYISAPIVVERLYACAGAIEVTGLIYGAKLTVFVDDAEVAAVEVTDPDQQTVGVPELKEGRTVYANQEKDGVVSKKSNIAIVRNHKKDYPDGLPPAEIDPTMIHACGRVIAVRHLRGAQVTVFVNGGDPVTVGTAGNWTNIAPAIAPFNKGDVYTARYSMCGDPSPLSNPETAVDPPDPMPEPEFAPADLYAGQELTELRNLAHGAFSEVSVVNFGVVNQFSTAVSWMPNIDIATALGGPVESGDKLSAVSELCVEMKTSSSQAKSCDDIPAPSIRQPFVGDDSVTVTSAVPGARILVYDAGGNELGDGSGGEVALSRAIEPGDVLTVLQKIGQCVSDDGYVVGALCTSKEQGC